MERWSRGLLSALLNVPDEGLTAGASAAAELVDSPYPWASLGVAIGAAVTAGLILAPLDLVRTKFVLLSGPNNPHIVPRTDTAGPG
jgi:mitochondrial fusion and transport protein UGO1